MIALLPSLRFGLRTLSKSPGFAATAIVTLGVAIGLLGSAMSACYLPAGRARKWIPSWRCATDEA